MDKSFVVVAPVWGLTADQKAQLEETKSIHPTPPQPINPQEVDIAAKFATAIGRVIEIQAEKEGDHPGVLDVPDEELQGEVEQDPTHAYIRLVTGYCDFLEKPIVRLKDPASLDTPADIVSRMHMEQDEEKRKELRGELALSRLRVENEELFHELWAAICEKLRLDKEAIHEAKEDQDFMRAGEILFEDGVRDFPDEIWDGHLPDMRHDWRALRDVLHSLGLSGSLKISYDQSFLSHYPLNFDDRPIDDRGSFLSNAVFVSRAMSEKEDEARTRAEEDIAEFLLRCRVLQACDLKAPFHFLFEHGDADEVIWGEAVWPDERQKELTLERSAEDMAVPGNFAEYWKVMSQVRSKSKYYHDETKDARVWFAQEAFRDSFMQETPEKQIVEFIRCLESLTGAQKQKTTDRLVEWTARMIDDSDEDDEYLAIERVLTEAYDVRSRSVHGQKEKQKKKEKAKKQKRNIAPTQLAPQVEACARRALKRFMGLMLCEEDGAEGFLEDFRNLGTKLKTRKTRKELQYRARKSFPF